MDALISKGFMCEPDTRTLLKTFVKKHKKSIYSSELSLESTTEEKRPVGRPSKIPKPPVIETTWRLHYGILQLITTNIIEKLPTALNIWPENRPFIRLKSNNVLNIR